MTNWAISLPALLLQVSVKAVSADSVTALAAPLLTLPTPWSIVHVGTGTGALAYVQVHVTLVGDPEITVEGNDVNASITGAV
jgi:hypothetical protein